MQEAQRKISMHILLKHTEDRLAYGMFNVFKTIYLLNSETPSVNSKF